ncbi:MAG: hypothetical protein R3338_07215, partial [Thermoanaerobaculia bacterium]|nr:hypothetical protein [Thermoanaerobaculia bacterium]
TVFGSNHLGERVTVHPIFLFPVKGLQPVQGVFNFNGLHQRVLTRAPEAETPFRIPEALQPYMGGLEKIEA